MTQRLQKPKDHMVKRGALVGNVIYILIKNVAQKLDEQSLNAAVTQQRSSTFRPRLAYVYNGK